MRAHSTLTRRLLASTVPAALLLSLGAQPARTDPMIGTVMNSYGLPGAVDTPTAEMLPDATLGATLSYSDLARRNTLVFQVLPRLTVALRYSRFDIRPDSDGVLTSDERRGYVWD